MKILVEKKDLISLLGKTQNIVEKKNTMPILINVLMEANDNTLKVFATDLEVSLTDFVQAKVIEPGQIAAQAKNLFDIVKELSEGEVQLTSKDNNWLEIKQGKYTSKIKGVNAQEYPTFPTFIGKNFIKLDSQTLKDMIEKTIYSVSTDETRYHLNGVYFERGIEDKKQFRMVGTDGHRLSLVDKVVENSENFNITQGVIIPRKGINEIRKLVEVISNQFEMAVEGPQLIVKFNNTILMVRLIEGKYPNYQQFIPQKLKNSATINKELLLTSLKRVSLLANQKSKGVTFVLTDGKLEVSSNNPDLGDAKEEIEIAYSGTEIKVGFNAKYITDVLNSINDEKIDFLINDALQPGLIRPHNDSKYVCVIMPMRI